VGDLGDVLLRLGVGLVMLAAGVGRAELLQLGKPPQADVGVGHAPRAVGDGLRHFEDVAVGAVIGDEDVGGHVRCSFLLPLSTPA
jgi:hypothetical protein